MKRAGELLACVNILLFCHYFYLYLATSLLFRYSDFLRVKEEIRLSNERYLAERNSRPPPPPHKANQQPPDDDFKERCRKYAMIEVKAITAGDWISYQDQVHTAVFVSNNLLHSFFHLFYFIVY
jgi:hypothetical protein